MKKTPTDLEQLGQKIARLRQKEAEARHEVSKSTKGGALHLGFRICVDLLSAVVVGAAIGYVADELFGTKPWFMSLFLLFGGAAGVLNVYRLSKQEEFNH